MYGTDSAGDTALGLAQGALFTLTNAQYAAYCIVYTGTFYEKTEEVPFGLD